MAIGALNVGKIQINIESEIVNLKMNKIYEYKNPIKIKKGEEIGCFHIGSTIVILSKNS